METKKKNKISLVMDKLKSKKKLTPSTTKSAKWKGKKSKSWLWL